MKRMSEKSLAANMKTIESRRNILEKGVESVAKGFTSALFVYGPGGLGKSHLLTMMLKNLTDKGWRHHTAHSTPTLVGQVLEHHGEQVALAQAAGTVHEQGARESLRD